MNADLQLADWQREFYVSGGGNPLLFYAVHGKFEQPLDLDRQFYRSAGVPSELSVNILSRENNEYTNFYVEGYLGNELQEQGKELYDAVISSPECLIIAGEIPDPSNLNYLRDTIGFVMATLDQGGIAVCDPQRLTWWSRDSWEEELFDPESAAPKQHVIILSSLEEHNQNLTWIHTRGMRKFGRPDLSIRNVPQKYFEAACQVCNRFIDNQAFGMVVPEGQEIRVEGLPDGMTCRHKGDLDDPDFNNVHIEMIFPGK